eukprot:m.367170 g.367170  ORF g.367170 m.367170 type:complete len:710 (+) comp20825_c0_seq1:135-2264(+)
MLSQQQQPKRTAFGEITNNKDEAIASKRLASAKNAATGVQQGTGTSNFARPILPKPRSKTKKIGSQAKTVAVIPHFDEPSTTLSPKVLRTESAGRSMARMASQQVRENPRQSQTKEVLQGWRNLENHLGVQGPKESRKSSYQNPYSTTPSKVVMRGGVSKKKERFARSSLSTTERYRQCPMSPENRKTKSKEIATDSNSTDDATAQPQASEPTPAPTTPAAPSTETTAAIDVSPVTHRANIKSVTPTHQEIIASEIDFESFQAPVHNHNLSMDEPTWDDSFSFKSMAAEIPTIQETAREGSTTSSDVAPVHTRMETKAIPTPKNTTVAAAASPAVVDRSLDELRQKMTADFERKLQIELQKRESQLEATIRAKLGEALSQRPATPVVKAASPRVAAPTPADTIQALNARLSVTKHRITSLEERVHLLLTGAVQSELGGNMELIGLMSQIGANTKDVDMIEQKINALAMEHYGAAELPASLFTVNQRSSELARRLNARITVHGASSRGSDAAGNSLNWSMSSRGSTAGQGGNSDSVQVVDRRALQAVQTAVNTTLQRKHNQVVSTAQRLHHTQQQLERVDSMRRQQARMLHAMAGQMDRSYHEEQSELARARRELADLQAENTQLKRRNSSAGGSVKSRGSFVRLTRALSSIKRKKKSSRRDADQESTTSSICGSDIAGKENVLATTPVRRHQQPHQSMHSTPTHTVSLC